MIFCKKLETVPTINIGKINKSHPSKTATVPPKDNVSSIKSGNFIPTQTLKFGEPKKKQSPDHLCDVR